MHIRTSWELLKKIPLPKLLPSPINSEIPGAGRTHPSLVTPPGGSPRAAKVARTTDPGGATAAWFSNHGLLLSSGLGWISGFATHWRWPRASRLIYLIFTLSS